MNTTLPEGVRKVTIQDTIHDLLQLWEEFQLFCWKEAKGNKSKLIDYSSNLGMFMVWLRDVKSKETECICGIENQGFSEPLKRIPSENCTYDHRSILQKIEDKSKEGV